VCSQIERTLPSIWIRLADDHLDRARRLASVMCITPIGPAPDTSTTSPPCTCTAFWPRRTQASGSIKAACADRHRRRLASRCLGAPRVRHAHELGEAAVDGHTQRLIVGANVIGPGKALAAAAAAHVRRHEDALADQKASTPWPSSATSPTTSCPGMRTVPDGICGVRLARCADPCRRCWR